MLIFNTVKATPKINGMNTVLTEITMKNLVKVPKKHLILINFTRMKIQISNFSKFIVKY